MQQQQTLSAEQVTLWDSFVAVLSQLSSINIDILSSNLSLRFPGSSNSNPILSCLIQALMISQQAKKLLANQEFIPYADGWVNYAETINSTVSSWESPNLDISSMVLNYKSLTADLSALINLLPDTRRFIKLPLSTYEATYVENALSDFVQIGKDIVIASDFANSKLDKLDQLLLDMDPVITTEVEPTTANLNRSFVALAAPSMEGKTQSAFTLRRVKPLYFPLSEAAYTDVSTGQYIYRNFRNQAIALKKFALEDISSIDESQLGAESLSQSYGSIGLWTLGFLKKIVELAGRMVISTEATWMYQYADLGEFSFVKASINSIPAGYFAGFIIFLDEFKHENWSIFVRNLARAKGIKCVCANTNTKIANIIGVGTESGGNPNNPPLWSLVIIRLNSASEELLNNNFGLNVSIATIKAFSLSNAENQEETNSVCEFLDNFRAYQLNNLRPGVAVYFARALSVYAESLTPEYGPVTLGKMMDCVITQVSKDLAARKPSLNGQVGTYGKISLLFPENYYDTRAEIVQEAVQVQLEEAAVQVQQEGTAEPEEESESSEDAAATAAVEENVTNAEEEPAERAATERVTSFSNQSRFLEEHLYYLHNPQRPGNWMFCAFPPANVNVSARLRVGNLTWDDETTHFEPTELITMLSCLFIRFTSPVTAILQEAARRTYRQSSAVYDTSNPNAFSLSGNPLEVSAAVSVVDATHHSFEFARTADTSFTADNFTRPYSFGGQSGSSFVSNLVINLISDPYFRLVSPAVPTNAVPPPLATFRFHQSDIFDLETDFLDRLKVPFIYAVNRSVSILDSCSDPASGFFLKTYTRTGTNAQVDGEFEVMFNGQLRKVVAECKNKRETIGSGELKKILDKASKREGVVLNLVFCNRFSDPKTTASCAAFCRANRINVYRVKKGRVAGMGKLFRVLPFFDAVNLYQNPRFVCILFESRYIN